MAVRLKDIAEAAHLELSSVGRILRDDPRALELREETRERVKALAREMGYRRNVSASTIRKGCDNSTIALVCDPANQESAALAFDAMNCLSQTQIAVRCYTGYDLENIYGEIAAHQIPCVVNNMYSGEHRRISAELACRYGMKMAFIVAVQEYPEYPIFSNADFDMMGDIVRYLHGFGHDRIVFICGRHGKQLSTLLRHDGFIAGMKECGCPVAESMIWCDEFDRDGVLKLIAENEPTAVCAIDYNIAMRTALALERAGVVIPDELSFMSFGSTRALETYANPPITAIESDVGPARIQAIMDFFKRSRLGEDAREFSRYFRGKIIVRQSVAAPGDASRVRGKIMAFLRKH